MTQLLPSGKDVAQAIKDRCKAIRRAGTKLTIKQVFQEAGLSYLTYKSWMGGRCHPRPVTAEKVENVLKKYEQPSG